MATVVLQPTELHDAQHRFVYFRRPWLTLYGLRVRQAGFEEKESNSLLQRLLPEELLINVFTLLTPTELAAAQLVCRQWRRASLFPDLWKTACEEAFRIPNLVESLSMARTLQLLYRGCWRRMYLERPHLRFDGLYVSRNTHIRTGQVEWNVKNAVHLVAWYRYYRFFPDGVVAYRTSPHTVAQVAKTLVRKPRRLQSSAFPTEHDVLYGQYRLQGNMVYVAICYANAAATEIRHVLRLRSTCAGANNRLDFNKMFSFNRRDGQTTLIQDTTGYEADDTIPGRQLHARGSNTCVFVPFHHVADSVLNTPVTQMDFYVPG